MHEAVRVHRALPCASVFAYCTRIGKTHFVRHEASLKRWVGAEAKPEEARKSWLERMLPETSEQKRLARLEAKQASQLDKPFFRSKGILIRSRLISYEIRYT